MSNDNKSSAEDSLHAAPVRALKPEEIDAVSGAGPAQAQIIDNGKKNTSAIDNQQKNWPT